MRRYVCALLVIALLGCGGDDDGEGNTDPYVTRGKACNDMGTAYCRRADACDLLPPADVDACVGSFVTGCCAGPPNTCSQVSARMQSWLTACANALNIWGCSAVAQPTLPPQCLGATGLGFFGE